MVGLSHGAKTFWIADGARDLAIRTSLAVRNPQQFVPAALAEFGSAKIKRQIEVAPLSGEVFLQLLADRARASFRFFPCDGLAADRLRQSAIEFEHDQGRFRYAKQQWPNRRRHSRVVKSFHKLSYHQSKDYHRIEPHDGCIRLSLPSYTWSSIRLRVCCRDGVRLAEHAS